MLRTISLLIFCLFCLAFGKFMKLNLREQQNMAVGKLDMVLETHFSCLISNCYLVPVLLQII